MLKEGKQRGNTTSLPPTHLAVNTETMTHTYNGRATKVEGLASPFNLSEIYRA